MNKKVLSAALVEEFFKDIAMVFDNFRDEIDELEITESDGREEELYATILQNYAIKIDGNSIPLIRQIIFAICNTPNLFSESVEDIEDYIEPDNDHWVQQELFEELS